MNTPVVRNEFVPTRPQPPHKCEFCTKPIYGTREDTVCGACDRALKLQFAAEDAQLDKAWASKHKCKQCKRGLTRDRMRNCYKCAPPSIWFERNPSALEALASKGESDDSL